MKPVSDRRPSSAPAAARAPNARPCSSVMARRIGATTTGRPPSQPAMRGPQRRPARVVAVTSPGASVSLSRSSDIEPRRVAAMELRLLGRTGVQVSPLCLGAMMFGAWGNTDHKDSIRIINRALDAGINFIAPADVYSRGESEEIVGKALADGRRENVVLATKVHGRMGDDPNEFGNSRRWIVKEVENSLRRLGTDWIDLYQIHRPEPDTDIDETLGVLRA